MENKIIIGIDHGNRNMQTANTVFSAAIQPLLARPDSLEHILEYQNQFYYVGGKVPERECVDKTENEDYYLLTMAALAQEMRHRNLTDATVKMGAALPPRRFQQQKESFKKYLTKTRELHFRYEGVHYHVTLENVFVFMQGHVVIHTLLELVPGYCLLVDIGGGTTDLVEFIDGMPDGKYSISDKAALYCISKVNEEAIAKTGAGVPAYITEAFMRTGNYECPQQYREATAADGSVLVKKDSLIERAVSNGEGKAVFQADIPLNFHYSVKEIQAPDKYYMTEEVYRFFYEYKDDSTYTYTFSHDFKNEEVRGEIHVSKIDKDSQGFISQGDTTLVGAKYGLYAAEDIVHPNKKDGIVLKKGELVAQGVISNEGILDFKVQIVHRDVTVKETVKKQAFQLIKISEDGEQTETELVEGAGFKVFLISELSGVKDGSLKPGNASHYTPENFITYDYSKDETASYWENSEKITVPELFTDKKGYLKSPELPYGTYVVFESTVPENLKGIRPFIVQISEDSREHQVWRVFDDRPLQYYFKIVKKDAQTQKPVLDNSAAYKIYDLEAEKYVEMIVRYPKKEVVSVFKTNEEGYLITPEQLKCGIYRIEEVEAPENYVQVGFENALLKDGKEIPLNETTDGGTYQEAKKSAITITVDSNTVHQVEEETGKFIVVIEQYNDEAVGSLTIQKKGEKLEGASKIEKQFFTKLKNGVTGLVNKASNLFTGKDVLQTEKGYDFIYEEGGMEGVEFAIYARETIYTPDGQKDEAGNRIVKYEKDALVARMITDKEGKAVLNNLPIGKYYAVEEKAGQNCVLDKESKEFEITYKGQEVAVDYVTMDVTNKRQKISLSILKKDAETEKPLEGVVFGLYAEEDIQNAAGEVVVEKDSLIELAETDKEGKLVFKADLPHGKYYVREVEHKPGKRLFYAVPSFNLMEKWKFAGGEFDG